MLTRLCARTIERASEQAIHYWAVARTAENIIAHNAQPDAARLDWQTSRSPGANGPDLFVFMYGIRTDVAYVFE